MTTKPTDRSELALDQLRATIHPLMREHHVPGLSIAVTSDRELLYAKGFGWADLAHQRPATADTGYLWFSMSKIATATAAMRLADAGRLDLDAPVTAFLPSYRARSLIRRRGHRPEPRIRQLLNHTAGAPNPLPLRWIQTADQPDSQARELVEHLRDRARPTRPIGTTARYSNLGYLLLAEIIATAAAEPFEQYVHRAVLDPSGMTRTGYTRLPGVEHATGYVRLPRPLTPILRAVLPRGAVDSRQSRYVALRPFRVSCPGYGGLIGSPVEAAKLLRVHLADGAIDGQRILAPDTARAMRDIRTPGRPFDLGLGWFRRPADRDARPSFVEHWGTGGGYWNAMRLYPELRLGIVVMANTTSPYNHHALMSTAVQALAPGSGRVDGRPAHG